MTKYRKGLIAGAVIATMVFVGIGATERGVDVYDLPEYDIRIVDAGEWGEVIPLSTQTPDPTPVVTAAPTQTPDWCPSPLIEVTMVESKPLREVSNYNKRGAIVWRIYKFPGTTERIIAKAGKVLCAFPRVAIGDGGIVGYRLYSSQEVDGDWLPLSNTTAKDPKTGKVDGYLYVLLRHVG